MVPTSGYRAYLESSAGRGGYSGAGRQAQPGTGRVALAVQSYQGIQNAFAVGQADALSVVDHPQDRALLAAVPGDVYHRRDPRSAIGDGVVDQVLQQHPRLAGIRCECQFPAVDGGSGRLQNGGEVFHDVLDNFGK